MPSRTESRSLTSTLRWSLNMPRMSSPISNRVRYAAKQITRMSSFCAMAAMPLLIYTVSVWMKSPPAHGIVRNANLNERSALHLRFLPDLQEPSDEVAVLALSSVVRKAPTTSTRFTGLGCGSPFGIILISIWISHLTTTDRRSVLYSNAVGMRPTSASSGHGSVALKLLSDKAAVVGSGIQPRYSTLNPPARRGLEYLENRRLSQSPSRKCGHGMPLRELARLRTTQMRLESARSLPCPRRPSRPSQSASSSALALDDLRSWLLWLSKMENPPELPARAHASQTGIVV